MIDGTYDVTVGIPFGKLSGTVTLASDGATCQAKVQVEGVSQEAVGTTSGDTFDFAGEVASPLGKLAYDITGTANGETLSATAKTKAGNLRISGRRA